MTDKKGEIEKKFITSPAQVESQRRVKLQDAYVSEKDKNNFRNLCKEYADIFSKSSEDIGHTPLVTMDLETGDSPPICQRPYSLPLKHVEWVTKELEILEKAGVISRSVSPWASPIVIVPKKSEPGEPPRGRLCVDYRVLNSLLPPVNRAHSKAQGILTLVPLPKIDEIYAQLQGSKVFSAIDMRSGYSIWDSLKRLNLRLLLYQEVPMVPNMSSTDVPSASHRLLHTFKGWFMKC